jgi:hypothetical protein
MLEFLRGRASERKLRLYAAACCRKVWHLLVDESCRKAVDIAEDFADGRTTRQELAGAWEMAGNVRPSPEAGPTQRESWYDVHIAGWAVADVDAFHAARLVQSRTSPLTWRTTKEGIQKCLLIRDIAGNPFRSITLAPTWLTGTVTKLVEAIYEERAFERLPILADALEEAGCSNAHILQHCRSGGDHIRGCWVIDLLTGRE